MVTHEEIKQAFIRECAKEGIPAKMAERALDFKNNSWVRDPKTTTLWNLMKQLRRMLDEDIGRA